MIYKLSTQTEAEIKAYLTEIIEAEEWEQYLSNLNKGIHNCVYLGKLVKIPAEYDEEGNITKELKYYEGYHADVMCDQALEIPDHITEHSPQNPKHTFDI